MKARLNYPEDRFPISVIDGGGIETALTFPQAEKLRTELSDALVTIRLRFQCTNEDGTRSCPGWRCPAKGSVKQPNGTYLCKRHAKKVAK